MGTRSSTLLLVQFGSSHSGCQPRQRWEATAAAVRTIHTTYPRIHSVTLIFRQLDKTMDSGKAHFCTIPQAGVPFRKKGEWERESWTPSLLPSFLPSVHPSFLPSSLPLPPRLQAHVTSYSLHLMPGLGYPWAMPSNWAKIKPFLLRLPMVRLLTASRKGRKTAHIYWLPTIGSTHTVLNTQNKPEQKRKAHSVRGERQRKLYLNMY